jgi:hypothetical protein
MLCGKKLSSFLPYSWGEGVQSFYELKKTVVSEHMASTVSIIHSNVSEFYDCSTGTKKTPEIRIMM